MQIIERKIVCDKCGKVIHTFANIGLCEYHYGDDRGVKKGEKNYCVKCSKLIKEQE